MVINTTSTQYRIPAHLAVINMLESSIFHSVLINLHQHADKSIYWRLLAYRSTGLYFS